MNEQRNMRLRTAAKNKNVNLWEVAERFGVNDATFSRWLRQEFTPEKMREALKIIDDIASAKNRG